MMCEGSFQVNPVGPVTGHTIYLGLTVVAGTIIYQQLELNIYCLSATETSFTVVLPGVVDYAVDVHTVFFEPMGLTVLDPGACAYDHINQCGPGNTDADTYIKSVNPDASDFIHVAGACIGGHNMQLYSGKTVSECAILCNSLPDCVGFEYGVDYGQASYAANDCQPQSGGVDAVDYDCSSTYNLDLYVKKSLYCPDYDTSDSHCDGDARYGCVELTQSATLTITEGMLGLEMELAQHAGTDDYSEITSTVTLTLQICKADDIAPASPGASQ